MLRGVFPIQAADAPSKTPASIQGEPPDLPSPPPAISTKEPPDCPEWIEQDLLTVNEYSRPGTKLDGVSGVVVHYVGNPGTTARQNHSYFQNLASTGETYASSHFLIGLEGEIIQNVPLDEVAYCSSSRNNDTISIECCHPDSDGAFTQATYDSLVRLASWLTEYYQLDASQVIRHYDVTGKECPIYYVRNSGAWEIFLADLEQERK
jgi:N-acetylmuramoyl-L-alanine amidase